MGDKLKRKWAGVVVDEEYWKAVKEIPDGKEKEKHYLFGGEPLLSMLVKNNRIK